MQVQRIPFTDVPQFSQKDVAYATQNPAITSFAKYPVTLDAFEQVIADKEKDNTNRELLVKILLELLYTYLLISMKSLA